MYSLIRSFTVMLFILTVHSIVHAKPFTFMVSGTLQGTITDSQGNALPYATAQIKELNRGTVADQNGKFNLVLAAGTYTVTVKYIGYQETDFDVTISDGQTTTLNAILNEVKTELEGVTVYGALTRGQAKALNNQRTSLNIKNVIDNEQFLRYPDVSAAETVQRLPGISITRDQGEGEFVQIRGVPEQFNALTINGQRMPSMEPDAGRAVGLDLVQSYLIQTITVTKALTPDMDADALGGMVDFQLREAAGDRELELYAGYGINEQETEYETFGRNIISLAGVGGKRFMDNKFGALISASYFNTDRGSMFNAYGFDNIEANTLSNRRSTDYDVNRERYGFIGNFDFTPNANNKFKFTANHNRYIDDEIRRQARYTFSNSREERRTRNRIEDQSLNFFQFSGEHKLNKVELDYSASYSVGDEDLPDRTEWRFRRTVEALGSLSRDQQQALSANSTFGVSTPMQFTLVEFSPRFTQETNKSASVDVNFPINSRESSSIKVGLKYRELDRDFTEGEFAPELNEGSLINGIADGDFGFPDLRFTDSGFRNLGFSIQPEDINYNELDGYEASETVAAGYVMNVTNWSNHFTSLVGARVERTTTDYTAIASGLKGEGDYINVLPSAHLTYKFDNKNQLRVAYSSALSRPNYSDLVPFVSIGDDEINRGNENLEAITANNFDIMFERYTDRLGFIGVGVFAKLIDNQIISRQVGTQDALPIFSPVNGASADVFGFEASINQSLSKLNLPLLRWISVNANYTFTESNSNYGDDRDNLPLAHSPKHIGNVSFLYDNPNIGLSAVIGGVYRHFIFDKLENADADAENENIWLDKTFHLDLSISYSLHKLLNIKLQLNNLTNQANTEVNGIPSDNLSRVHETESYGMWGVIGLEFKL